MAYTLNRYFQLGFKNLNVPRVVLYPNNTTAAQILNHHKSKELPVVRVADCLADGDAHLPMPDILMSAVDVKIKALNSRTLVIGLDAYLALLDKEGVNAFISEIRSRLDGNILNADYLLSVHSKLDFAPRYAESRSVITIEGSEEALAPLSVQAYSDKWVRVGDVTGYKKLLEQISQHEPSGNYDIILTGLTGKQAGIGNAVSFIIDVRDVAVRRFGIDADLDDAVLEMLLSKSSENGQNAQIYLESLFGVDSINTRLALKRLLELTSDKLWAAHIWLLRKRLPSDSYIVKTISDNITRDNLLRKYVVDTAVTVLSDTNAKKYALERAESLKAIKSNYESLIVEFIGQTKNSNDALRFLNCDTNAERIEIVRRAAAENLSCGIPKQYEELFPMLSDYLGTVFDYGDKATTTYFEEYRKLKISNRITDNFVKWAYEFAVPKSYPSRDTVLGELQEQPDVALLVIDAMGAEYMPLLLTLAKRLDMNIESRTIATTKLPTETEFNPIKWDEKRVLSPKKGIDNIVHYGAEKHEASTPERNFVEMLRKFESVIMTCIAEGLTHFARVAVTADHGASRLAVIARNENKGTTLPWDTARNGQPDNWRYTLAPQGVTRPSEFEQAYFPETGETYWIVRGYNRLPKSGGKLYELHGGATLEERLVPIVVFTRNSVTEIPKQLSKKATAEVVDEFEGLI